MSLNQPKTLTLFCILAALAISSCSNYSNPSYEKSMTYYAALAKARTQSLLVDRHGAPSYPKSTTHRYVRTTAYSCQENEPGAYGNLTALGTKLIYGSKYRSAAADWSKYPAGTEFKIKGLPYTYIVEDYGSALVGTNTIDIYHPNLRLMKRWGTRNVSIKVTKWGDKEKSLKLLKRRAQKYPHCRQMYEGLLRR